MQRYIIVTCTLVLSVLAMIASTAHSSRAAAPWYVSPGGSDSNDCATTITPCASINGALSKPGFVAGDTVLVATGIYTGSGTEVMVLNKSVTLSGGWDQASFTLKNGLSIVDGEKTRRDIIVTVEANVIIDSFLVRNGYLGPSYGLSNGAGINNSGNLTLDHVAVSDNTANSTGGGIYNSGTLILNGSSITNNQSVYSSGGGIYNLGNITFVNTTISNNWAWSGGGIFIGGGAVHAYNSTIVYNDGSGITGSGDIILQNSILAQNRVGNVEANCQGTISSSGYNLLGNTSDCTFNPTTGDMINVDPKLALPFGIPAYYPLLSSSPAIDAGNPTGCIDNLGNTLLIDERGIVRANRCDIGSYEYTVPGPAASVNALGGTPQHARPSSAFAQPLQAIVLDSAGTPISGTLVTFTSPLSGATATFSNTQTYTTTSLTNERGIATSTPLIANLETGNYTVTATVISVSTSANFLLGNIAWYVAPVGVDTNDCQTPMTPCRTINGALTKAGRLSADALLVGSGTYTGTGNQVVSFNQDADLSGGWDAAFTVQSGMAVIDGKESRRGITVNTGARVNLDRFMIQNGSASVGGGIKNNGFLTLHNSQVSRNSAQGLGGGIANYGTLTITNSTIDNNTALVMSMGGGIFNDSKLTVINSTISGNKAIDGDGGGIATDSAVSVGIFNSTISQNYAQDFGGGLFYDYNTIALKNTILAGNSTSGTGPDCGGLNGQIISWGHNLVGSTTGCSLNNGIGDIQSTNPGLMPLAGSPGIHMLLPDNPAIDAGDPTGCVDSLGNPNTVDERGFKRPVDGNADGIAICDIGAIELQALEASYKTVSTSVVRPGQTLTYTIALMNTAGGTVEADVTVTDTIPTSLTYQIGSLVAESGVYDYTNGTITWRGPVTEGVPVSIVFAVQLDPSILGNRVITNSVIISNSTEVFPRSITFRTGWGAYLPILLRN